MNTYNTAQDAADRLDIISAGLHQLARSARTHAEYVSDSQTEPKKLGSQDAALTNDVTQAREYVSEALGIKQGYPHSNDIATRADHIQTLAESVIRIRREGTPQELSDFEGSPGIQEHQAREY